MKNYFILTSVFLGSSMLAIDGRMSGHSAAHPSLDDKKVQGDKNTPEGKFSIAAKRVHEKWCRFLSLDYPTPDDIEKFNKRKEKGEIPANASIGGGIGIHGTWPHEDFVVDRFNNWTLGCISMKNEHVTEIYQYTGVGTKVTIKK